MATRVDAGVIPSNDTDAHFRAWGQVIGAALVAMGLVKLSAAEAAGQINWATVTTTTAAAQQKGFEVYRFADALQATAPVFIRIDYGSNNAVVAPTNPADDIPGITVQVGTGVNAATGALTGVVSVLNEGYFGPRDANSVTGFQILTCGGAGRIAMAMWWDAGKEFCTLWGVERTKNGDGSDNGDGVLISGYAPCTWVIGSAYREYMYKSKVLLFTGVQADSAAMSATSTAIGWPAGKKLSPGQTGIFGAHTAVYPWLYPSSRGLENAGLNWAMYWNVDIGAGSFPVVRMFGQDHTYRSLSGARFNNGMIFDSGTDLATITPQAAPAAGVLMRWE